MKNRTFPAVLLAAAGCFLLASCQANDQEIPETAFTALLKLAAGDAADGDGFGLSVAIDGDFALVGSPGTDGDGTNSGAAYLFLRTEGGTDGWGQVAKLVAGDAATEDLFGFSVDISGDYAVIGAAGEDGAGEDRGAAYIFFRNQGGTDNWGQVYRLRAGDPADGDGFGFSVAIDGDTVIVGADGKDGGGADRGAAYVFSRNQGGEDAWGQVAKLVSGDPNDADHFGYSVAIDGDIAVVGSPYEDGAGEDRGAAYVFSRDLGGADAWGLAKRLVPGDASDGTWFGWSAATDGTLAVVGAPWDDGGGTNRGAAYLFARDQGGAENWGELKKLVASDAQNNALFGYDTALYGDYVVAGAGWSGGGGTKRGQAYIFSRDEGGAANWGQVQRLRAGDGSNEDWFGFSVAIDGTYILCGASGEDGAGSERGAAYVFKKR